jgi:hypothetical protein
VSPSIDEGNYTELMFVVEVLVLSSLCMCGEAEDHVA